MPEPSDSPPMPPAAPGDRLPLRHVMSRLATGVVVLTVGGEHTHGMTANAFSSVCLDPPLVLCCVGHSAIMHGAISSAKHFAVSILAAGQERLARYFADKQRPLGPAQFDDMAWLPGVRTPAPLLAGSLGWIECELLDVHPHGDHSLFLGTVLDSYLGPSEHCLLFFEGHFHRGPAGHGLVPRLAPEGAAR